MRHIAQSKKHGAHPAEQSATGNSTRRNVFMFSICSAISYKSRIFLTALLPLPAMAQTVTNDTYKDIPAEVLSANAPYGFDITPDETVWLNMAPVGRQIDYSVRARDFLDRKLPYVSVWIRGYHKRNPAVAYRESKLRISFDCQTGTYRVTYRATYGADGTVMTEDNPWRPETMPVVPGSQAANWQRFICRPPEN